MSLPRARLTIHPAIPAAVIMFCLALVFRLLWPIRLVVGEVTALVALALAFRYWPPIIAWFGRMPGVHRATFFIIFFCVLAGHFSLDNRRFFPLISWEIFSNTREIDPVSCPEFLATTASGKTVRLLIEQLFPSIVQFYPPANDDSARMTPLIHTLAVAYNQQHPDDPVRRVDLVQMSVKLHASGPSALPTCQLLQRYDVSSDRSN